MFSKQVYQYGNELKIAAALPMRGGKSDAQQLV